MADLDLIGLFVLPLQKLEVEVMISGSVASIQYGEPRLTLDVDLVLVIEEGEISRLSEAFPEADYYLPPVEVLTVEARRASRGHFNVIHLDSGMKADCYPSRSHPYWQWARDNRRSVSINGQTVWFAPPEYVVLWKLEFYREGGGDKHLRDIRGMLRVSNDDINREFIESAVEKLGLEKTWKTVAGD